MQILDEKLEENWENYLLQSLAAGLSMVLILGLFMQLKSILHPYIVAAAGSTAFTVFAMPHYSTSQTRNIIGSHSTCVIVGFACSHLTSTVVSGGIAVGIGTLLMVSTKTEHPPAAGTALGLAVNFEVGGGIFILGFAVAMAGIRILLLPWLKDLM